MENSGRVLTPGSSVESYLSLEVIILQLSTFLINWLTV